MTHHSDWMRPQGRRLSRRAALRAGARVGAGAAGLVLVGCGGKNGEPAAAVVEGRAEPDGPQRAITDEGGERAATESGQEAAVDGGERTVARGEEQAMVEAPAVESAAVDEAERERVVAAVHPAIEGRAGVPVDRTTIGFPEASIEITDFSDFQ